MQHSALGEIELPETKPETEWISGRAVQKVMPSTAHSLLQFAFAEALNAWAKAGSPGLVGTEWRFRVTIPGVSVHPLVPDVAYMSLDRFRPLVGKDRVSPPVPPEILVEVLSPDDRASDVEAKRAEYLAWGVSLVIVADADARTIDAYDATVPGTSLHADASCEAFTPPAFPDLQLNLRAVFAALDILEAG